MKLRDEIRYRVYTSKYKCLEVGARTIEVRDGVLVSEGKDGSREVREDELLDLYDATGSWRWAAEVNLNIFIEDLLNTIGECSVILDDGKMLEFFKSGEDWLCTLREEDPLTVGVRELMKYTAQRIARALVNQL